MSNPPAWLVVGRIVAAFGTKGEIRVQPDTDFPERFAKGHCLYIEGEERDYVVQQTRLHKGQYLLKLEGLEDRDEAERLRGRRLRVPGTDLAELEEGEYYVFQIVGMAVQTEDGRPLGTVTEVLHTGANDVYVVMGDKGEILLPAISDVIRTVDLEAQRMTVHLLPGLLPEESEVLPSGDS